MKRVLIISDTHCGSQVGLTPPDYQYRITQRDTVKHNKYARLQAECWKWFTTEIDKLRPIDILVINGDAIDGSGDKTGGTEQITTDKEKQAQIAIECIDYVRAKHRIMTYGTAYHTGYEEDWENIVAQNVGAKIGGHEWIDVNGVIFDLKHKVGRSSIPHGRMTIPQREKLWAKIWSDKKLIPKVDIIIRSHVHYFTFSGDGEGLVITTPCLKAMGDKYGSRQCSGIIDYGFVYFDIEKNGSYDWKAVLANLENQKTKAVKL